MPSFTITPLGVLAHVLVLEYSSEPNELFVLLSNSKSHTHQLALHLTHCPGPSRPRSRPLFRCGNIFDSRLTLHYLSSKFKPYWKDVYILHTLSAIPMMSDLPSSLTFTQTVLSPPFRISANAFKGLSAGGFKFDKTSSIPYGSDGSPPLTLRFYSRVTVFPVQVQLTLGRCSSAHLPDQHSTPGDLPIGFTHWATVVVRGAGDAGVISLLWPQAPEGDPTHRCPEDHVYRWSKSRDGGWLRCWSVKHEMWGERSFVMMFTACSFAPTGKTLVLKVAVMEMEEVVKLLMPPDVDAREAIEII